MADFTLLAAQVRAARSLLGWSQGYLAEGINVRRATIADFENGKHDPHHATLTVLMKELAAAGIVFTEKGRRIPKMAACAVYTYRACNQEASAKNGPLKIGAFRSDRRPIQNTQRRRTRLLGSHDDRSGHSYRYILE
jgi:DNA-binding XRE family transcriptional regulator